MFKAFFQNWRTSIPGLGLLLLSGLLFAVGQGDQAQTYLHMAVEALGGLSGIGLLLSGDGTNIPPPGWFQAVPAPASHVWPQTR
jgi:hypothetical protein